jgi:hypothetical protein
MKRRNQKMKSDKTLLPEKLAEMTNDISVDIGTF